MFRITEDPSSGSLVQCLAKNYKNDSIVSVDMDKVGVMASYSGPLCLCVVHCIYVYAFIYSELHTRTHKTGWSYVILHYNCFLHFVLLWLLICL